MRARNVKPGFFKNPDLAECGPLAQLLFAGLWCMADKAGRLKDRPRAIKAEVLPYHDCDCDQLLSLLAERKFIVRYEVEDERCIEVLNFSRHQRPHPREVDFGLPAPVEVKKTPRRKRTLSDNFTNIPEKVTNSCALSSSSLNDESLNDESLNSGETLPASSPPTPAPSVMEFPVDGNRNKTEWPLLAHHVAQWQADYPSLDVLAECHKARAWCIANPTKRKTARGMPAFIVNWLNRATNQPRNGPPSRAGPSSKLAEHQAAFDAMMNQSKYRQQQHELE